MAAQRWTDDEDRRLRNLYEAFSGEVIPVDDIAALVGHSPGAVRYRAHKIGLTEPHRPRAARGAVAVDPSRECAQCHTSFDVRRPSDTQKFCSRSCAAKSRGGRFNGRAKVGRRSDLHNVFFRSSWEANYARILNDRLQLGEILSWEYEPHTFRFPVQRGNKSYMPDFRVWLSPNEYEWHEVKGWMDSASRIKLRRFNLHFPLEAAKLTLIDRPAYMALAAAYSHCLKHWES